ncbi:hypothetical protein AB3M80_26595 [Arthrospira platensis BEA 1257B]
MERSRNPTQSARLGVIKFLWGFLGSHNLLLVRSLYTTDSDSSRLGRCDRFTQHTLTLVGWVERSRNPTQSARLGVIKFLWGFLGSHNLLLVRSLYTTDSDSSRLAGAIALHNRLGL